MSTRYLTKPNTYNVLVLQSSELTTVSFSTNIQPNTWIASIAMSRELAIRLRDELNKAFTVLVQK